MGESQYHIEKQNFVLEIINNLTSEVVFSTNIENESQYNVERTQIALRNIVDDFYTVKFRTGTTPIPVVPIIGIYQFRPLIYRKITSGSFARCVAPYQGVHVSDVHRVKSISTDGTVFTVGKPGTTADDKELPEFIFAPY